MEEPSEGAFRKICRENGWRFTRQRFAVYSFMCGNRTHPSVDDVWDAVRRVAARVTRESVFRILCELAEAGVIARLDHLPMARFDCSTRRHGHFICSRCGKVMDFDLPADFVVPMPMRGVQVAFAEVRLSGICAACQR